MSLEDALERRVAAEMRFADRRPFVRVPADLLSRGIDACAPVRRQQDECAARGLTDGVCDELRLANDLCLASYWAPRVWKAFSTCTQKHGGTDARCVALQRDVVAAATAGRAQFLWDDAVSGRASYEADRVADPSQRAAALRGETSMLARARALVPASFAALDTCWQSGGGGGGGKCDAQMTTVVAELLRFYSRAVPASPQQQ